MINSFTTGSKKMQNGLFFVDELNYDDGVRYCIYTHTGVCMLEGCDSDETVESGGKDLISIRQDR